MKIKWLLKNNERVELRGWGIFFKKFKKVETQEIQRLVKKLSRLKEKY